MPGALRIASRLNPEAAESGTAAISIDSTLTIQGDAALIEDQIKYGWNCALLVSEGPTKRPLSIRRVKRRCWLPARANIRHVTPGNGGTISGSSGSAIFNSSSAAGKRPRPRAPPAWSGQHNAWPRDHPSLRLSTPFG
jgi:hypothetical protein